MRDCPKAVRAAVLFAIDRRRSYILSGSAKWELANTKRIVLTDLQPDAEGHIDLSLHAFEGLRVYPSYVKLDAIKDAADPIPHIRLHTPAPVPRVTLVWEHP